MTLPSTLDWIDIENIYRAFKAKTAFSAFFVYMEHFLRQI